MSIMMNPVLPVPGTDISIKKTGGTVEFTGSFAMHLDQHLDGKYGCGSDKLGVAPAVGGEIQAVMLSVGSDAGMVAESGVDTVQATLTGGGNNFLLGQNPDSDNQGAAGIGHDGISVEAGKNGVKRLVSLDGDSDKLGVRRNGSSDGGAVVAWEGVGNQRAVAQNDGKKMQALQEVNDFSVKGETANADAGTTDEDVKVDSAADLLNQFMAELQAVAEKNVGVPGEWKVALPDVEILQQLAADAGMDEVDFSQFMQQLRKQDNKMELTDFFQALTSHFEEMKESIPVTVPEAEAPMLESLLEKMGIPRETVVRIADKAVIDDGKFDLNLFVKELAGVVADDAAVPVVLTDVEVEQLQDILAEAGLTLEARNKLLPERFLNQVLGEENAGEPVQLTVARLEALLGETVSVVRDSRPAVNLPLFLNDLQKVIVQADFETAGAGWTPVVENSVEEIFRNLQELVDLAQVRSKAQTPQRNEPQPSTDRLAAGQEIEERDFNDDTELMDDTGEIFSPSTEQGDTAEFSDGMPAGRAIEGITAAGRDSSSPATGTFTVKSSAPEPASPLNTAKNEAAVANQTRLPQQVLQQLSDGVVKGLKNQEHHLVLRLFPQDLGEVKVNLTVRDEHVSVSFNMENTRVKEILESNMEEFKNSMNQRGFTLGECSVSVGQQNTGDAWQKYEMARQAVKAARETMEDLPADALYLQSEVSSRMAGRENGINLIV